MASRKLLGVAGESRRSHGFDSDYRIVANVGRILPNYGVMFEHDALTWFDRTEATVTRGVSANRSGSEAAVTSLQQQAISKGSSNGSPDFSGL